MFVLDSMIVLVSRIVFDNIIDCIIMDGMIVLNIMIVLVSIIVLEVYACSKLRIHLFKPSLIFMSNFVDYLRATLHYSFR